MKKTCVKNISLLCLPFAVSAAMLTVIQAPISWAALAWVSLVPFILGCSPSTKPKKLALAAYLVSVFYWLVNLYWIFPITIIGWIILCLYMALLWPILALCLRYCRIKKIPLFLAAAVLFVGAERMQGAFLGGFFWRFLAHSQYQNITLIQIADIFGASGVSFLIAMVNGLLAELILAPLEVSWIRPACQQQSGLLTGLDARSWKRIFTAGNIIKTSIVCAALIATIVYGRWRIGQSDKFIEAGPLVASLQSNVPQSVKREALRGEGEAAEQTSQEIFDELMEKSKASLEAGAELIVWPETMVQGTLNKDVLIYLDESSLAKLFDKALREHSKNNAYLLVGAYGGTVELKGMEYVMAERYNSAFLYRPDGEQDAKQYDKIHLVLFGEVLPFRKSFPLLFNLLMKFNPLGYDHSLDAGSEYTVFEMTSKKTQNLELKTQNCGYKFSVMICYEGTIPAIARRFALDEQGQKQIHWLINISNDGWFVRFKDKKGQEVLPSAELPQHAAICAFRAVENRLSILRSVNTGISCLIDSLGQIREGYIAASADFPVTAMERKGMAGWFVDRMPIDKRRTFFSKYGQWLDFCSALCVILLIIVMSLARFARNNKYVGSLRRRQNGR